MAEIVFILGAGASAHAGVPVMNDFFGAACDIYDDHKLLTSSDIESFDLVRKARQSLDAILAKMRLNLDNIEILFSLIEMGKLINRFPGLQDKEIIRLHEAMHDFIIRTIELSTNFIFREDSGYSAPEAYEKLANYIGDVDHIKGCSKSSILTFNYDIAIDHALENVFGNNGIDYCLEGKKSRNSGYRLLKLHGSLNWARIRDGGQRGIEGLSVRDFILNSGLSLAHPDRFKRPKVLTTSDAPARKPIMRENVHFEIGSMISKQPQVRAYEHIDRLPLIVPPTWSKTEYHPTLARVWAQAAKEISEAKYIYVIGYSLPETDLFFRHLLGLGMLDILRLKRFRVFDPAADVGNKFRDLLGSSIQNRYIDSREQFNGRMVDSYIKSELEINGFLEK